MGWKNQTKLKRGCSHMKKDSYWFANTEKFSVQYIQLQSNSQANITLIPLTTKLSDSQDPSPYSK